LDTAWILMNDQSGTTIAASIAAAIRYNRGTAVNCYKDHTAVFVVHAVHLYGGAPTLNSDYNDKYTILIIQTTSFC